MSNTPLTPTTVLTTTAVSTSPERADQVVWTSPTPADPPIEPAVGAVTLVGRVTGIPPDHELWVVSKPFGERTDYFVVEGKRQRVGDGSFTAIDYNVGAPTDRAGDGFSYVAVDADDRCSRQLTEASRAAYEKGGDRSRRVTGDLSPGCFLLEPTAIIRFR